jgi:hypothetical protein
MSTLKKNNFFFKNLAADGQVFALSNGHLGQPLGTILF